MGTNIFDIEKYGDNSANNVSQTEVNYTASNLGQMFLT